MTIDVPPARQIAPEPIPISSGRGMVALRVVAALIPLLLLAYLLPLFFYQAIGSDRTGQYLYPWQARWIGSPYKGEATACFRKVITVNGSVESAYVAVSGDNFFTLQVNGRMVRPFFAPEAFHTWVIYHSLFNSLGYPRNTDLARIYNIAPYLTPGRNVIGVKVQSDQNAPHLALQGVVTTAGGQIRFGSDGTWRCAPYEQVVSGVPWTDAVFSDIGWTPVTLSSSVQIPVDGEASVFESRLSGDILRPSGLPEDGDYRFRTTIQTSRTMTGGWLRLASDTDYDVFINGVPVTDTAWTGRYSEQRLAQPPDVDSFPRIRSLELASAYLPPLPGPRRDVYLLNGELPAGRNVIEVVVHPHTAFADLHLPVLYIDGKLTEPGGSSVTIGTGMRWEAQHVSADTSSPWMPCSPASTIDPSYQTRAIWQYGGDFDPNIWGEIVRSVVSSCGLAVVLLLIPLIAIRYVPSAETLDRNQYRIIALRRWAGWCIPPTLILLGGFFIATEIAPYAPDIGPWKPEHAQYLLFAALFAWCIPYGMASLTRPVADAGRRPETFGLDQQPLYQRVISQYAFAAGLTVIALFSAVIAVYHIGVNGYVADEYVSIYAAHGIRHYGLPVYPQTGIMYTRSSLYHYTLALFQWLGGGTANPMSNRLLACVYQLGTILVTYHLGKETAGRKAGLLAALLVAFSPYTIFYASYARFYSQFQFFITLIFLLLLKSIRHPEDLRYRYGALLAFCGAYLAQQFAIVVLPSAIAILLLSGQLHTWFQKRMIPWILMTIAVMAVDFIAYNQFSVTPKPFLDTESVTLLSLHTDILELLPGMLFLNQEHCQAVIGVLYLTGFFICLQSGFRLRQLPHKGRRSEATTPQWRWWSYLYLASAPTVFCTTLLAPRPASRYIVDAAALVIVAAAATAYHLGRCLCRWTWQTTRDRVLVETVRGIGIAVLLGTIFITFRPFRVWSTLSRSITINNTDAARFIAANRRPGDAVIFRSPEVALVELGSCDYVWRPRRGSIFMYLDKNRRLRERDSGALLIDNIDKMHQAMLTHKRLWLVVPEAEVITPGTQEAEVLFRFVKNNFRTVREPLGVQVFLWDRSWGHWKDDRNYGYDSMGY